MKILFVTSCLEHPTVASHLALLARRLPRPRFKPAVALLGHRSTPVPLAGVPVTALGRGLGQLVGLRRLLAAERPDVVHAYQASALRALLLAGRRGCLAASHLLRPKEGGSSLSRLDRWLLGRADRVLAAGHAEADVYRRAGLAENQLRIFRPAVEAGPALAPVSPVPAGGRYLLCLGPLAEPRGFQDALWAFDVLRRVYTGLYLVLEGDGPDRARLQGFARAIRLQQWVRFLGPRPDRAALLASAAALWAPSRADVGQEAVLAAQAAGCPVIASAVPGLAEVVADDRTGFLVPPGDKVALARRTRVLLDDEPRRQRLTEAARRQLEQEFSAEALLRSVGEVYQELAG